jgi:hypothetical protein
MAPRAQVAFFPTGTLKTAPHPPTHPCETSSALLAVFCARFAPLLLPPTSANNVRPLPASTATNTRLYLNAGTLSDKSPGKKMPGKRVSFLLLALVLEHSLPSGFRPRVWVHAEHWLHDVASFSPADGRWPVLRAVATLRLAGGGVQEDSDGCCELDMVAPPQEEAYHQVIVRWRLLKRPTTALGDIGCSASGCPDFCFACEEKDPFGVCSVRHIVRANLTGSICQCPVQIDRLRCRRLSKHAAGNFDIKAARSVFVFMLACAWSAASPFSPLKF